MAFVEKAKKAALWFAKTYWFYIGLAIFVVIARFAPNFARHGGLIRAEYTIGYGAVALIFLGSGLSMGTKQLMANMANWRAHTVVLVLQFLITPAIMYGFCCAIRAAHNPQIDDWLLVGLIVTACCPTTVASNVVMTRQADGNELLTLSEVFIGNMLGAFITPALCQMFFRGAWEFGNPANGSSITRVYRDVMQQIGCSVFVPTFVGQVVQNLFPKQTKWFLTTFRFNKVGSFMLLLVMFSSFSTAFYQHAFTAVSHASIILVCFFNVGIYMLYTVICFAVSRPIFLKKLPEPAEQRGAYAWFHKTVAPFYYDRPDTVAVMLCGAAKTAALGVSLVSAQYGDKNEYLGQLLVPLVLYQSEQVLCAGFLTRFMKMWIHAEDRAKEVESDSA
ncbi:hypothetical protein KL905_004393 [Ogataea polymorpha]|uniref:Uncharacterized protein n=1 Tax=Ogataea polymorpha TaxID=460523 RepID=A0A9P8PUH7_9ASCO|nr:hypothetical protein KL937_004548 [Ogataea polymorpha]KAG7900499.1 hypothetical protein KL907_004617 [Ogataea polymorpha]KAG7906240.1 hypothetical protein KL906_004693 [Ogataea polymorpha]KAG7917373.1 hypothetical protein KL905_004393 [Ogataea polymorpha]KAG7932182.1 hypothetical protein KL904_004607 [Ogataea polymorpha]